ncbi:hypothetical protein Ancab_019755 [Ancistrocladus abbreviatus]
MAFRATGNMIHMLRQAGLKGGNTRPFSTASESSGPASLKSWMKKADMAPVYIVFGFVTVAVMIAVHTAKQQLVHCPSISFDKKKRSGIPEVDEVSATTRSADKFIGKSFLRKVAHIQDESKQTLPNPIRGNVYTSPRRVETLESTKAT